MRVHMLAIFALALTGSASLAEELILLGDQRWLVTGIYKNLEVAIAYARAGSREGRPGKVFKQKDGRFAAVVGPASIPSQEKFLKSDVKDWWPATDKSSFSKGEEFIEQLYAFKSPVLTKAALETDAKDATAKTKWGDWDIEIAAATGTKEESSPTIFTLRTNGKIAFTERFETEFVANGVAKVVRLDPASPRPQILMSNYSGGPHCCTATRIARLGDDGIWKVFVVSDGDDGFGYALEDLDGDGAAELIGKDDRFLGQFGSYADAVAPPRVLRFTAGKMIDATRDPAFSRFLRQESILLEDYTKPEDKKGPGYLAGWVASKSLQGEGKKAWAEMLKAYDRQYSDCVIACKAKLPLEECPANKQTKREVSFPVSLSAFLGANGYVIEGITRAGPPAMRSCYADKQN
jgi:hypothetical protein